MRQEESETGNVDTLALSHFHTFTLSDSLALINEEILTFGRTLSEAELDTMRQKFGGIQFDGITRFYPLPENLVLPYKHNNITFEFAAIEPARPYMVKYQYILEGYDKDWSPVTNKTSAGFGNIYEGTYTFKLKACNPDGVWSKPITYIFKVLPPWWRTWWMYAVYVLFLVSCSWFLVKWRERKLIREKTILEEKVKVRTAELQQANEEITAQKDEIITQRDQLETSNLKLETLNFELEKLSIVASETENSVIICDKDGVLEWVNRGFERLYGLTLEQFTAKHGKTIYQTSSNPDFKEVVNEAVKNNRSITYNSQFTKETGKTLWLQTTLTPIFYEDGNLKKLVAIDSDITKIKEAEEEIHKQKKHIEEIHKDVTDSINYAKRIQTAILPERTLLKEHFTDHFILFKPRNVVSGDFYWWAEVTNQLVITVADCTGHGVPGAFMSMLGISFLREIVRKEYMTEPSRILHKLRKEIINALKQKNIESEQKDGMDISLCSINTDTLEMQWAGANNPLYIIRSNPDLTTFEKLSNLEEIKPDRMPIGIYDRMDKFTTHEIKLNKGDIIYLTGDGYKDQIGGPNNKKFMSKRLKELLLEISAKPMEEQHEILNNTINDWMNSYEVKYEQTDDITVMGIKIS